MKHRKRVIRLGTIGAYTLSCGVDFRWNRQWWRSSWPIVLHRSITCTHMGVCLCTGDTPALRTRLKRPAACWRQAVTQGSVGLVLCLVSARLNSEMGRYDNPSLPLRWYGVGDISLTDLCVQCEPITNTPVHPYHVPRWTKVSAKHVLYKPVPLLSDTYRHRGCRDSLISTYLSERKSVFMLIIHICG